MYIKEFALKQHTPIIHFQADNTGATLRASEVKPKLDKFLIKKLGGFDKVKQQHATWFANKEHPALDYSLSFVSLDYKEIKILNGHKNSPMYFGNMGDGDDKHMTIAEGGVLGKVKTKHQNLSIEINQILPEFFFLHNFGTRQSKGYGSFTVESIDDKKTNFTFTSNLKYLSFTVSYDFTDVFIIINYYFQRLKSGINFSYQKKRNSEKVGSRFCEYKKAFIYTYINDIKEFSYNWDKKWLKEKFFPLTESDEEKRFVRAFLGLSYDFKFMNRVNPCFPNSQAKQPKRSFNVSHNSIIRIKSPLIFKPIKMNNEWRVYIHVDDNHLRENEEFLTDKDFSFSNGDKNEILKTPSNLLDYNDLISEYHKHLTNEFTAYNFIGNSFTVKIKDN